MDLREELGKAFEATDETVAAESTSNAAVAESPVTETTQTTETAKPETVVTDGRARDEQGRFTKSEKQSQEETQQVAATGTETTQAAADTTQQASQQQTTGVDLPPSTWTATAKAEYAKLPEVVRNEIKKRESDFQKGIGQYKQAADFGTRIDSVMRPYANIIREKGGTPEGVIGNLLQTAYALQTGTPQQKAQLLLQAAQQYGADMSMFGQKPAEGQQDPNIEAIIQQRLQPVLQELNQFKSQFTTTQQQREQQEQQTLASQIESFRTATDEKGQPKHVYFDNVRGTMAALIESGDAANLDQAYEMACRAHPEVSKLVFAEQRSKEEAQRLAEQRRLADEAKRANTVNAQGQGGVGIADTSKVTLRDELMGRMEGRIA